MTSCLPPWVVARSPRCLGSHGLVGESGSGKSQIAFSTLGILPKEALILGGSVLLDGQDLLASPALMQQARGRIGSAISVGPRRPAVCALPPRLRGEREEDAALPGNRH
jgi:ABC-type antimicrobial peptide transport system ATPase subunit